MLCKIAFPPLALQAALFALGLTFLARDAWFMPEDHVPQNDESWEALLYLTAGVVGSVIFIPLHWMVLGLAGKLRISVTIVYLLSTVPACLLCYILGSGWAAAVTLVPLLTFMACLTWTADVWNRKQENAAQRACNAFVRSRKLKLKNTISP